MKYSRHSTYCELIAVDMRSGTPNGRCGMAYHNWVEKELSKVSDWCECQRRFDEKLFIRELRDLRFGLSQVLIVAMKFTRGIRETRKVYARNTNRGKRLALNGTRLQNAENE